MTSRMPHRNKDSKKSAPKSQLSMSNAFWKVDSIIGNFKENLKKEFSDLLNSKKKYEEVESIFQWWSTKTIEHPESVSKFGNKDVIDFFEKLSPADCKRLVLSHLYQSRVPATNLDTFQKLMTTKPLTGKPYRLRHLGRKLMQNCSFSYGICCIIAEYMILGAEDVTYELKMSSVHDGPRNTYEALQNDDLYQGAGTLRRTNQFIAADFHECVYVSQVELAPAHRRMTGTWGALYVNGACIQYLNQQTQEWETLKILDDFTNNEMQLIPLNVFTNQVRLYRPGTGYLGVGTFRFV